MMAFLEMYAWFTKATGLKQSERMASWITLQQVKTDEAIANATEAWGREEADLKRIDASAALGDPWLMTAIKNLLPQRPKEHIEMNEAKLGSHWEIMDNTMG